MKKGDLKRKS